MKASLKFKDDSNPPLLRLKVPLNILGFPFQSGVSACGDPKDLSLNLATLFDSGPSLKLLYKPNDSWNPFSLVVKTGVGSYGSANSSPLSISAEFNLLSRGNPSFVLRVSPKFGDFGFKKLTRSGSVFNDLEKPKLLNSDGDGNGVLGRFNSSVSSLVSGVGQGVEVSATSALPIRKRAVVKFNWGVKIPNGVIDDVTKGDNRWNLGKVGSLGRIPFLVMNKISIEHVAGGDTKKKNAEVEKEIGEVCLGVKRELDLLHVQNGMLRRAVEEIRSEIGADKSGFVDSSDISRRKTATARKPVEVAGKVEAEGNEGVKKGLKTSNT